MIGEITNHLWQSTLFAIAVALLAVAFRKNRAEVRYWLWLSASLKFLIPFSLLINLGIRVWDALPEAKIATPIAAPSVSQAVVEVIQPFPESFAQISSAHHTTNWIPIAILSLWAFGFFCVALMRCRSWFRICAAVRAGTPINIATSIPVLSSVTLLEPGVVGFLRLVLLLPEGILKQLSPLQLEAVLAHEQCHIRRRDNLTSAFHMVVEAIFWFHPIVWWIGTKLVEERERACDEAVLRLGNEPQVYAEGILNVCKSYLESPLRCVSGVTGSDLKKRIRTILMGQVAGGLSFARKVTLIIAAVAAIAVPILGGIISAPSIRAQSPTQSAATAAAPQEAAERKIAFDVASIKPVQDMHQLNDISTSGPRLDMVGVAVKLLIMYSYDVKNYQVPTTPALSAVNEIWYDIHAEAAGDVTPTKNEFRRMTQSLLADRFKLTIHHEMREMPVYALVVDKNGPKFKESAPDAKFSLQVGVDGGNQTLTLTKATMEQVTEHVNVYANRPIVDKTGLTGTYDIKLEAAIENSNPEQSDIISIFTAVQKQLGLKLVPQRGMVEVIVVDHVEKPSKN